MSEFSHYTVEVLKKERLVPSLPWPAEWEYTHLDVVCAASPEAALKIFTISNVREGTCKKTTLRNLRKL